jgi:ribosomal biogenesis protein LAS1
MRPVLPLLKQYKALSKIVTRDASMRSRYQSEITKVLRDIERWVSEAKVAASITGDSFGWDVQDFQETDDNQNSNVKERLALEGLCDGLLAVGCLVPLSKR